MSTLRRGSASQRALAMAEQSRLQQVNAQPSRLARMMEQPREPTPLQRKIALAAVTKAGSIDLASELHLWASQHISRAHVVSHHNVYRTMSQFNAVLRLPMDEQTAENMAAWSKAQKSQYIRHEAMLLEKTMGNITAYAGDPLPQEDEEQPRGILGWLRGKRS